MTNIELSKANSLKWLWDCYTDPLTRQQINSNYMRMYNANPTTKEMQDWKIEFIQKSSIKKEDIKYFEGLTYEVLQAQWAEEIPESHYSTRRKKK